MKRTLQISLFFLLFSLGPIANGSALANGTDIANHWASSQLQEWLNQGIIKGYDDGSLKPNNAITRAEFATLINKAFGFTYEGEISYADVSRGAWYDHEIRKGTAAGYMNGYGDGTVKPEQPITREEAVVMLDRILQPENEIIRDYNLIFTDKDAISEWSVAAIKRMTAAGYVKGYEDRTFKSKNHISRAEAVVMLSRVAGEIFQQAGTYGPEKGTKIYSGNVTITAGNVKLTNAVIKGDLLLAEAIGEADIVLKNVVVEGKVRVCSRGAHSVYIEGNSDLKDIYVNKKTGTVRIVLRNHVKIETMTIQTDAEMSTDESTVIDHLILNRSTRIHGKVSIGLVEINANGVNIERFPTKIKIKDGLKAIIEGKEYPSVTENQNQPRNDTVPVRDNGQGGGGGGHGGGGSKVSVTGIRLDHSDLTLKPGETTVLTATVIPHNATNKRVTWRSSNPSVATVSEGVITAVSLGTTEITAETEDRGFRAISKVTVAVPTAKPSITSAEITAENELIITFSIVTNQSGELADRAAVDAVIDWGGKSLGANYKGSWSVINGKSVLTITILDVTGRNLAAGDTIMIKRAANVRDESNTSDATDAVAVVSGSWVIPVTGIALDPAILSMKPGESASLFAKVTPTNATNKDVIWTSGDESVVTVTGGVARAISAGSATITVVTVDGGFSATSLVQVRNGGADVEISASDVPIIQQYPFTLYIRHAQNDSETRLVGTKHVTVTAARGDQSEDIFTDTVLFDQDGNASVNHLEVSNTGTYSLTITIEGISDPIAIRDVEVVTVIEAVLEAFTGDELYRALTILGILHAGEFDANTFVMENMQAYIDDFAISKPQTATEVQMRVDEVNDRTIAPQFAAGFPAIDELSDTRFDFMLKLNMDGIIYYLVVEDGAIPPTPEEVKAGQPYRGVTPIAAGSKTLILGSYGWETVLGVSANTKYDIYMVTESARGALSKQPIKLEVTTKPPIPPTFVNGYPKIDGLSDVQFNLILQASKAGTAYYIVVPKDASAPTSEQVKLGVSYDGASIVAKGSRSVPINSIIFSTVMGLLPYTEYDIYAVMEDAATGSLQQEPTKLQVTTLPDQPPSYSPGHPRILTVKEDSVQFRVVMTKRGNVYYMMVEKGVTPPTPQEVKAGTAYQDVIPVKAGSSPNVTQNIVFTIEGLAAGTEYMIYIVVESEGGTLIDQPAVLEVTTPPTTPAQFVSGNPSTRHEEEDRFILALNLTRAGTVHYMVVPKDSDMPNAEEVKAGSHYRGITPVAKGTLQVNPNADVLVASLSPDTEYDIYAVIEDALFGLQSPVKIRAKTIPDSPPVYWDEPHVFDVSDTEFKLQMGITKPGYGYYLVQRTGESPPTSEQVKANPTGIFDLRPVGALWQYVRNLTPETAYDIYVVAETTYGTLQAEPIKLEVTTMEQTDPPAFILGTPYISYTGKDRIDFDYKLNKAGTVHYLFLSPDAQAPTAEQVVAGVSYEGVPIIRSGQVDFIVNDRIPFLYIEGLTPGTTYAIYIVGKSAGGKMTPVARLEATTKP